MKATLLLLVLLVQSAQSTLVSLGPVKMPLYLHGSDTDPRISIMDVPVIDGSSSPEEMYSAISRVFTPPSPARFQKTNVNMASSYGILASLSYGEAKEELHWIITVDASSAKKPEGHPFSVEQVVDAVVTCVKLMSPMAPEDEHKITIKVLPPSDRTDDGTTKK